MTEIQYGEFRFIASQAALTALCAELRDAAWLALDTEFERSRSFYAASLALPSRVRLHLLGFVFAFGVRQNFAMSGFWGFSGAFTQKLTALFDNFFCGYRKAFR